MLKILVYKFLGLLALRSKCLVSRQHIDLSWNPFHCWSVQVLCICQCIGRLGGVWKYTRYIPQRAVVQPLLRLLFLIKRSTSLKNVEWQQCSYLKVLLRLSIIDLKKQSFLQALQYLSGLCIYQKLVALESHEWNVLHHVDEGVWVNHNWCFICHRKHFIVKNIF